MKLCVFQGTFNPIHKAHLKMADYVIKNYGFDKILFIPAFKPPHKDYDPKMSLHRYNMVKAATSVNPHFDVSDIEYNIPQKSYSYNTVKELYEKFPIDGKIKFIIGTDAFEKIESWYETEKFKNLVEFIVFPREDKTDEKKFNELKAKGYHFEFADMDFVDISSTELREKIKKKEPINDIITEEVEDYIKKNDLYKD